MSHVTRSIVSVRAITGDTLFYCCIGWLVIPIPSHSPVALINELLPRAKPSLFVPYWLCFSSSPQLTGDYPNPALRQTSTRTLKATFEEGENIPSLTYKQNTPRLITKLPQLFLPSAFCNNGGQVSMRLRELQDSSSSASCSLHLSLRCL